MAESACLRRSFSNPSETSHDFQQGDPLRALGDSISLGRYMSDSLDWGKWSTFSHNRYLEEAEKHSKPGSVAKMKAYFEAHYNKIGAKKQAVNDSSSVEAKYQSTLSNVSSLTAESTVDNNCATIDEIIAEDQSKVSNGANNDSSSVETQDQSTISNVSSLTTESTVDCTIDEITGNKGPIVELISSVIVGSCESSSPLTELQVEEVNNVESAVNVDTAESSTAVQVHQIMDSAVNLDTAESSAEVQAHQCKDAEVNVSITENITKIGVNQCKDAPENGTIVGTPERQLPVKVAADFGRLSSRRQQNLTDSSLRRSLKGNVSKLTSSFARLGAPVRLKRDACATPDNRKSVKESLGEKKPTSRLVHKSVNCGVDRLKKSSPVSRKSAIGKVFTPLGKIIRDRFDPSPAPSRASVKNCSQQLLPSATPQSEMRSNRSKLALEESFARSRTLDRKFQSPSAGKINSSVQSSTTISAFSFRTEERAAKRREFLEKRLQKEAEYLQLLDKAKVKQKTETRKSSQCLNLKSHATLDIMSDVLSDKTKKIAFTLTQLPRCGSKPALELPRGTCSHPPRKSIASKLSTEKRKSIPTRSSTLQTKKKDQENASPNIL